MATYTFTHPTTGQTVDVDGDKPPSKEQLDEIFAQAGTQAAAYNDAGAPAAPAPEPAPEPAAAPVYPIPGGEEPAGPSLMDLLPSRNYLGATSRGKEAAGNLAMVAKNMGLEGTGQAIGQAIGAPFEEFGGIHIGGAIGSFLGNSAAQLTTPGKDYSLGEALGAGAAGTIPGEALARSGAKQLFYSSGRHALANTVGTNIESLVEGRGLASAKDDAIAAGTAIFGSAASKFINSGARARATRNAMREAKPLLDSLRGARELGLILPPAATAPTGLNNTLQSLAGKASVAQEGIIRNQPKVNTIVRKAIGIPDGTELTQATLDDASRPHNNAFEGIRTMTPASGRLLEKFKGLQAQANVLFGQFRGANAQGVYRPDLQEAGRQALRDAEAFRLGIAQESLKHPNGVKLMNNFEDARVGLAQIAMAREGLRNSRGDIDPTIFGHAFEDAPERLTGDLAKLGAAQSAFEPYIKEALRTPPSGADWLKTWGGLSAGAGAGYTLAGPKGAVLGAGLVSSAPKASRELLLSKFWQNRMSNPRFGAQLEDVPATLARAGIMQQGRVAADELTDEEAQQRYEELLARDQQE